MVVVRTESERLAALPAWARQKIAVLEADLRVAREAVRQIEEGDSNVWIVQGINEDRPLPRDSRIRFDLGDCRIELSIRENGRLPVLEAYAGREAHRLGILPVSANVAYLFNSDLR